MFVRQAGLEITAPFPVLLVLTELDVRNSVLNLPLVIQAAILLRVCTPAQAAILELLASTRARSARMALTVKRSVLARMEPIVIMSRVNVNVCRVGVENVATPYAKRGGGGQVVHSRVVAPLTLPAVPATGTAAVHPGISVTTARNIVQRAPLVTTAWKLATARRLVTGCVIL